MFQDQSTFSGSQSRYTGTQSQFTLETRASSQTSTNTARANSMDSHRAAHTGRSTKSHRDHRDFEEANKWLVDLEVFGDTSARFPCLLCSQSAKRIPFDIRGMRSLALIWDLEEHRWKRRYAEHPDLRSSLVPRACDSHRQAVIKAIGSMEKQEWAVCGNLETFPWGPPWATVYIFENLVSMLNFTGGPQHGKYDASSTSPSESDYQTASFLSTSTYLGIEAGQIVEIPTDTVQKGCELYKRWRANQCSGEPITREEVLKLRALEIVPEVLDPIGHSDWKCLFCGKPSDSNSQKDRSRIAVWLRLHDSGDWRRPYVPQGKTKEESLAFHLCGDHRKYYAQEKLDIKDGETRIELYTRPSAYDVYALRISNA